MDNIAKSSVSPYLWMYPGEIVQSWRLQPSPEVRVCGGFPEWAQSAVGHNLDISFLFVSSDSGLENWRLDETEQIFSRCCDSTTGRILDYKIEICNNFHGSVAAESISLEL